MTTLFWFGKRSLKWFTDALFLTLPLNPCQLFFCVVEWIMGNWQSLLAVGDGQSVLGTCSLVTQIKYLYGYICVEEKS